MEEEKKRDELMKEGNGFQHYKVGDFLEEEVEEDSETRRVREKFGQSDNDDLKRL